MQSHWSTVIFGDREDPCTRLEDIFGEVSPVVGPPAAAREWATRTLHEAGLTEGCAELAAIRCLRSAEPRLTLRTAEYLAEHAVR